MTAIDDVMNMFNLQSMLNDKCKKPDHSIIEVEVLIDIQPNNVSETEHDLYNGDGSNEASPIFNRNKIPSDMFSSETCKLELINLINNIEQNRETQEEIDHCYDKLTNIIIQEMYDRIPVKQSKRMGKRLKVKKPYWNDELQVLWNKMQETESNYRKCTYSCNRKNTLQHEFKQAKQIFDRKLRMYKRQYDRGIMLETEAVQTKNPREFWSFIKKLGPRRQETIPLEVYNADEEIVKNLDDVKMKWQNDFKELYNVVDKDLYDERFYNESVIHKTLLEQNLLDPLYECNGTLNRNLSYAKVEKAVLKSKNKKAVGHDNIPNEVLKYHTVIEALYHLFQLCLDSGKLPKVWSKSIINPIPKDAKNDKRIPLNYRGISLLCCISKIYSTIINNRLMDFLDGNNVLVDEQNGFRPNRSCTDHIFNLTSVIRNKIDTGSVFTAFIDFRKAFDCINRELLLYRLLLYGIDGKIYNTIKSMYKYTESCVRINKNIHTGWFDTLNGVKQGDCLSTTLFSSYINELARGIKDLDIGIKLDDMTLSILLYADDIVLIADNEKDLQKMLDYVHSWCTKWQLGVNKNKTKVMHFRKTRTMRCKTNFYIGKHKLEYASEYKYLGVMLNEYLNFNVTADVLSKASVRALGALINKFYTMRDMGFKTYTTLYNTLVSPVMNYGAEIWGYKSYNCCQCVANKAMKFYLGVHKYTSNAAVLGECGWLKCKFDRWLIMCRFWNRLVQMDEDKLTYKLFKYDVS